MENRRLHHSLVTVFRIIADSHFPNYLSNPINNLTVQHGYSTRSVALPTPTFSRSIKEKSFYVNFVSHFNQLPDYIKHSQSVLSFKNKLKLFLLEKQFSSIWFITVIIMFRCLILSRYLVTYWVWVEDRHSSGELHPFSVNV